MTPTGPIHPTDSDGGTPPGGGTPKDPGREVIPIYRYQTAKLAEVKREGYPGPQLIWFYCPSCAARNDARIVEFELEVAVPGEEELDVEAFVHRRPTIVRLLARITREQAQQVLASFERKDNAGILVDVCRAPEDPTRIMAP